MKIKLRKGKNDNGKGEQKTTGGQFYVRNEGNLFFANNHIDLIRKELQNI